MANQDIEGDRPRIRAAQLQQEAQDRRQKEQREAQAEMAVVNRRITARATAIQAAATRSPNADEKAVLEMAERFAAWILSGTSDVGG